MKRGIERRRGKTGTWEVWANIGPPGNAAYVGVALFDTKAEAEAYMEGWRQRQDPTLLAEDGTRKKASQT